LLYDRYGQLIFSVALRITGDRGSAEEVTQDVFVRLWQHAERYRAERGSALTWLLTIARRRAIDELRSKRGNNRRSEVELLETLPLNDDLDLATLAQLRIDMRQALAELPDMQREAIELLFFAGLSRQEIASRAATPLPTIHTRLRLGMEKLRAIFVRGEVEPRTEN
jgi:RNA polymerase sigma-70 factor (ECF subfamily)